MADAERVGTVEAAVAVEMQAGTPASAESVKKLAEEQSVKSRGIRAIFASVLSSVFGKARDVRVEQRPAPHPPAPSPRIEEKGG